MIKGLLGLLVDFFPNHVFFSRKFESTLIREGEEVSLDITDSDDPHQSYMSTAMLAVAVGSSVHIKENGILTVEFTGVTDQGKEIGDYRITIERLN